MPDTLKQKYKSRKRPVSIMIDKKLAHPTQLYLTYDEFIERFPKHVFFRNSILRPELREIIVYLGEKTFLRYSLPFNEIETEVKRTIL